MFRVVEPTQEGNLIFRVGFIQKYWESTSYLAHSVKGPWIYIFRVIIDPYLSFIVRHTR